MKNEVLQKKEEKKAARTSHRLHTKRFLCCQLLPLDFGILETSIMIGCFFLVLIKKKDDIIFLLNSDFA